MSVRGWVCGEEWLWEPFLCVHSRKCCDWPLKEEEEEEEAADEHAADDESQEE